MSGNFNPSSPKNRSDDAKNYFIPLRTICPAASCLEITKVRDWSHAVCGADMEINCLARLRCSRCTHVEDSILNWRFACENHINEYREPDATGLVQAVTVVRAAASNSNDRVWYRTLALSLTKALDEREEELAALEEDIEGSEQFSNQDYAGEEEWEDDENDEESIKEEEESEEKEGENHEKLKEIPDEEGETNESSSNTPKKKPEDDPQENFKQNAPTKDPSRKNFKPAPAEKQPKVGKEQGPQKIEDPELDKSEFLQEIDSDDDSKEQYPLTRL